jgi:hypothetical protein
MISDNRYVVEPCLADTATSRTPLKLESLQLTSVIRSPKGVLTREVLLLWGTGFIIEGAASGVIKRHHDVTFPLLT